MFSISPKPSERPIIYVAGPIKPIPEIGRTQELNIAFANDVGRELYELTQDKVDIFIPHNFLSPLGDCIKSLPAAYFYSLDLGMLNMFIVSGRDLCIYLMRDWKLSVGTGIEYEFVHSAVATKGQSIKIATAKQHVKEWLLQLGVLV